MLTVYCTYCGKNCPDSIEPATFRCCGEIGHVDKIETSHVNPPIPLRSFDWSATFSGYEPGEPIGYGPTEEVAITDLLGSKHG